MIYSNVVNDCASGVLDLLGIVKPKKKIPLNLLYSGALVDQIIEKRSAHKIDLDRIILNFLKLEKGDICLFSFKRSKVPHHFAIFQGDGQFYHIVPGGEYENSWMSRKNFCFGLRRRVSWE